MSAAIQFDTAPSRYRHLSLVADGDIAWIHLHVAEDGGIFPGYALKLNSYDLGVDIELADVVNRLRFEHPEVGAVILTSDLPGVFCAGANIFMLSGAEHGFKVNFCKLTNETRLAIEDATECSGQVYVAAINGIASGGGYELALACSEIYLVDDRKSAVAFPEIPYLGVLPGTGGLTRLVDKRHVRRDLADRFCTLAEGVKGRRAKEWGLVDEVVEPTRFRELVETRARALAAGPARANRTGVVLDPVKPRVSADGLEYEHVSLRLGPEPRTAHLVVRGPATAAAAVTSPAALDATWYPLRAFRELDDVLLRLRFSYPEAGLVTIETAGDLAAVLAVDDFMARHREHWLVNEVVLLMKRVLKRLDNTARTFFALVSSGSCFAGSLLELALAADRSYMLDDGGVAVAVSPLSFGALPMGNGLYRLAARCYPDTAPILRLRSMIAPLDAQAAAREGLVTEVLDALDWDDELRLAAEERASLSPDALTAMESNLRFAGPETLETKIFGRLSAWQNWIFQRPNATGTQGALTLYGRPESATFDWRRT
ncbi:MAG: benzoyl-CoA-dihydrodiol lyase [Candidatus Schekmanbacteria bacterium]|nr:benzoyl-CoA-dihydrodiol lyase [Candidatus Schekmanbacteria bacterium]